ncbi:MAG: non-hydrolyzing UDP-N-acetylglucosamine 2-epimerase [Chitinophagales bacterium]
MKIMQIVGNRPQFIKLAILCKEMEQMDDPPIIIHTGQHFDKNMSDIFFEQLHIPKPNYQLEVNHMSHNAMIGSMLTKIDQIMALENPEMVVVYGDTNSTLAGALAAKKRSIPLAHIEAGVRTGNEEMPEEANRYLSDRMADLNFCCTYLNLENLQKEGYSSGLINSKIINSGDLMLDATLSYQQLALERSTIMHDLDISKGFTLATIHRAENTSSIHALRQIVAALNKINEYSAVLFPMHPRTKTLITQHKIPMKFTVLEALGYLDMLALTQQARTVITDSGGLCREAFFLRRPTLVIMRSPFWPELFLHGPCLQSKASEIEILQMHQDLLNLKRAFKTDIFGDGQAARRINLAIQNF